MKSLASAAARPTPARLSCSPDGSPAPHSPPDRCRPFPACRPSPIQATCTARPASASSVAAVQGALPRVYVPNLQSNDVYVIDPATLKVVDRFRVGVNPQHVVPSWDLKTLWVANNAENTTEGSLTPIDPMTGKPGQPIAVDDPYNMYFTPDGQEAIVVAEAFKRLDFRDPQTMALQSSLATPQCKGINHADFSIDGALRHLHLRVRRHAGQDRPRRAQGARLPQALERQACRRTSASRRTARTSTSPT